MNITITECHDKSNTPVIAASVACALVLVIAVVIVFIIVFMKKKRNSESIDLSNTELFNTMNSTNSDIKINLHGKEMELRLTSEIGRGSFATVWKAKPKNDDSNTEYAVKLLNKHAGDGVKEAQKEAMMMEQLDTVCGGSVWECVHRDSDGNCYGILPIGKSSECVAKGSTAIQCSRAHAD